MALITRVSRLFRADIHAVLDRIEEPDILLRQSIRDMEEALDAQQRRAGALRHDIARLETRAQELDQALQELDAELDICFESDAEDLARALVRRKLEGEAELRAVGVRADTLGTALRSLDQELDANQRDLDELQRQAELFAGPGADPEGREEPAYGALRVSEEDVEVALLRERRRRRPS